MKRTTLILIALVLLFGKLPALLPNITDSYLQEEKGNFASALDIMVELRNAETTEPFYQVRVAWLQYLLGRYDDSIASYRKAIALKDNLDARLGIVNCQLAQGKYAEAMLDIDELLPAHPQNTTLLAKGAYAAYMRKEYSRAVIYYQNLLAIAPWDMENRGYLVNNLFLSGQEEEGKRQLALLRKYYPQSAMLTLYKDMLK